MDAYINDMDISAIPELYVRNGITVSVNKSFTELTGYQDEDILGQSFPDFMKKVLRSTWYPKSTSDMEKVEECFIFSRERSAKKVKVSIQPEEHHSYLIVSFHKKNADFLQRIYNFLENIHASTDTGFMILEANHLTVLNANRFITSYINQYYSDAESCIGETIPEIFQRFGGIPYEQLQNSIPYPNKSVHIDEFRYDFPDKGVTYWDLILAPLQEDSIVKYIILVVKEVTETVLNRLRLEEQAKTIQDKNKQLQAIFDNVSDGLYIEDYSYDKPATLVNKHTAEFFRTIGISEQTPEGIKDFCFYDREGKPIAPENLPLTRLRKGEQYEQSLYSLRYKDREEHLSISGTSLIDTEQKLKMAILCVQLVTDRVIHEKELQQQRDLYYNIFDMLGLPIMYLSYPGFECHGLNRNSFGILKNAIKGTPLEKEIDENTVLNRNVFQKLQSYFDFKQEEFVQVFTEMKIKRETVFYNYGLLRDGKKVVYKLVIQPIIRNNQEISEIIITGIDITYEIEQREAAERLYRMKDELVYTITHEFKTPLTVINSAIQAMELLCWNDMPAKAKDYVKKIKQNSYRQLRLVNNLLDVNKISVGKMKINLCNLDIVHITMLITDSVQVYAQQKGIRLLFSSAVESRIMGIDEEKYERVLLNLLSNAIKFTSGGKAVYVRVSLRRRQKKLMACIEIEDEGIGIPEDKFNLIFERFGQVDSSLTRNAEGTGLGLALVKQLVEALDGEITVKSKMGEGSVFAVLLPAIKVPASILKNNALPFMKNQLEQVAAMELSDIRI